MTEQEAQTLKVGDRIEWQGKTKTQGTIIERSMRAFQVDWDDGFVGAVHADDYRAIERV